MPDALSVTLWVDALEPQPGGIGRYTWELCQGLAGHQAVNSLYFYGRNQRIDDPGKLLRGEPLTRRRALFRALGALQDKLLLRSALVHGPNYFLPPFAESGVITAHDLSVFRFPATHPAERVRAFEENFGASLERASHVITDTETVRGELIETFSLRPESVSAVHLGVNPAFRPQPAELLQPALERWSLRFGEYGLCVSTLEPRKRIAELVQAWERLPLSIRDCFPLVLAGGSGWRNEALRAQVEAGVAAGWLKYLGFVDEQWLPQLYAGAALFVYPSIYEGFGLPPLEAMASGVPVVVANRSCLPEVCGVAARYIDPDDVEGLTGTLLECLSDPEWQLHARRNGLERARIFTWDRCIDGTVRAYRAAAEAL